MDNDPGYTDEVTDHFTNPCNMLEVAEHEFEADGVGMAGNPAYGDMMKIWIKVDGDEERIKDLKWKTSGYDGAAGPASMLSVMVTENGGMRIDEALAVTHREIVDRLGGVSDGHTRFTVLGDRALKSAIHDFLEKTGQRHRIVRETASVVCHCINVTDRQIEDKVIEGVDSFQKLQALTHIATGCGQCRPVAERLYTDYRARYFG